MKKSFKLFIFLLGVLIVPALCQASTIILTNASPDHTITAGTDARVYGTPAPNRITLAGGSKAELLNFPGQNTIQVQANANLFSVSRSGSVVTFQGSEGTVLKIPSTTDVQTISFNGEESWILQIHNSQVMLDDHVVTTQAVPLDSFSDVSAPDPLIADDYKTLSDFTKAAYLAKLRFMSVMSNGFEEPYGAAEPKAEYVAAYADSHTRVLESLDNVTAAVERINAAREEPGAYFTPSGEIFFRSAEASAPSVFASDDYTNGKTEDSFLISAWDFLVNGLWGSASRSRERITNTLDQLSEEGRREAYEYAKTARGIMNRDDVEDNADDFWKSLKQGKYDNQCAVLHNDLTAPAAIAADIEFADVAERNSASGRPAADAVVEEGSDLIESARDFNPGIDGNVLGDELEDLVEKEMQEEVKKFQKHTEEHHSGDTDNAVEIFADSVGNAAKSGAFDPDLVEDLNKATKKAVDAIVPADDEAPLDQGLLTVSDISWQTEDGSIVIAEGEDAEGNPSVYISDMTGGDMTITLPEGFWEVTAAGVNSVIDSISAQVLAGLETLATVDTSEEQPADPVMEISTTVTDEDADSITYQVTATVSGVTSPTDVTLSLQNAQTWDNTTKNLSADGTVTWSVTVLENNGVITVTRSDTNEGQSLTLSGKTTNYNAWVLVESIPVTDCSDRFTNHYSEPGYWEISYTYTWGDYDTVTASGTYTVLPSVLRPGEDSSLSATVTTTTTASDGSSEGYESQVWVLTYNDYPLDAEGRLIFGDPAPQWHEVVVEAVSHGNDTANAEGTLNLPDKGWSGWGEYLVIQTSGATVQPISGCQMSYNNIYQWQE